MTNETARYVCVHGHFYQPPRENAWLEAIEVQDSAYPYHDWNERITAECYAQNAASRILDRQGRIIRIANNYASISYNFGPTLLAWLQQFAPETYARVLEADRLSAERFSGHGSAMAQCYNHMIMPLANQRDRRTQVLWGSRDFEYRFGRAPDGMWLPETAVDLATLDALAEFGFRFTILAPHQAQAVRPIDDGDWDDVSGARIDPSQPYLQRLPSGREIVIFFYDGPASRGVAFEGLLRNGERFAQRLLSLHDDDREGPQLAHIATDGETYGHHHRYGDMALAFALQFIDEADGVRLTNYAEHLERFRPAQEVRIHENTSWSCAHGVGRWRSDCGCSTGGQPGWNQAWRGPLRAALDWLRDCVAPDYERTTAGLLHDPWLARDDYIDVILDRSDASLDRFFQRHANRELSPGDRATALELLELQRHAMLMYTSCGWFFNDISGIETVQVLQYAARAIQLGEKLFERPIEPQFLERLESARSNIAEQGDGRRIYERYIRAARVDLLGVAAHHVVSSLFGDSAASPGRIYCYRVDVQHQDHRSSGHMRMLVGRARIQSVITLEADDVMFAVLHFGGQNLSGGVRRFRSEPEYSRLVDAILRAFGEADLPALLELLARFPDYAFSFKSLFSDRKREILGRLLDASVQDAEGAYRLVYERNAGLMRFLHDSDLPVPRAFVMAAEFVIDAELRRVLAPDSLDFGRARALLAEAAALELTFDRESLGFGVASTMDRVAADVLARPTDLDRLNDLAELAELAHQLPFDVDRWRVQNAIYSLSLQQMPERKRAAAAGDAEAARWVETVRLLGERLAVAVEAP